MYVCFKIVLNAYYGNMNNKFPPLNPKIKHRLESAEFYCTDSILIFSSRV